MLLLSSGRLTLVASCAEVSRVADALCGVVCADACAVLAVTRHAVTLAGVLGGAAPGAAGRTAAGVAQVVHLEQIHMSQLALYAYKFRYVII